MSKLILASSSKQRIMLLNRIGYIPDIIHPSNINEDALKKEKPRELAYRLAYEKAKVVHEKFPDDFILAADTVCATGRFILPKALTQEDAELCMKKLSGKRHKIYTGVCGIYKDKHIIKVAISIVKFKLLSKKEINFFIKSNEWIEKAGGYALQGVASRFIQWISGSDSTIIGLPCYETTCILESLGYKAD